MVTTRYRLVIQTYWFGKIIYLNIQQSYILLLLSPTTVIIRTFLQHRLLRCLKTVVGNWNCATTVIDIVFILNFLTVTHYSFLVYFTIVILTGISQTLVFWSITVYFPETISKIWKISIARKEWETSREIIKSQAIEEQDGVLNV